MGSEIEKKQKKLESDVGWNIFAIIGGLFFLFIGSGFFKYIGWFLLIAGGIGLVASIFYGKQLDEEAAKEEEKLTLKQCPACAEDIRLEAKKCKHCGEIIA